MTLVAVGASEPANAELLWRSIIVDKAWKQVTQITDRNVILVKGEVVFEGSSDELLSRPELLEQYLGV